LTLCDIPERFRDVSFIGAVQINFTFSCWPVACDVYQKNDGGDSDAVDQVGVGAGASDTSPRRFTSSPPTNDSFQFVLEHATETQSHTSDGGSDW